MSALVDVRNLSVHFKSQGGALKAVDGVSFHINKGELVGLVGESGSGKTVSALSILRLLPYPAASHPTGEVLFNGKNLLTSSMYDMREIRGGRISIIFQEPMTSLNPLHTIERQVGEIMKLHRGLETRQQRCACLIFCGRSVCPNRRSGWEPFPISSPAVSVSAS